MLLTYDVGGRDNAEGKCLPEMTKQPIVPDAGADGIDPSAVVSGREDGQVSRSRILQSALRIIDRDGVDGLSMRRLSEEVGRDPMVLYRHIPNKAALLDVSRRSCSGNYGWIPPIRTGRPSCARWPTTSAGWPCHTHMWCRCW